RDNDCPYYPFIQSFFMRLFGYSFLVIYYAIVSNIRIEKIIPFIKNYMSEVSDRRKSMGK
ncbi:hypothetical protein QMN07_18085, partial [Leptospira santarosai]|nr:hypothetical protein [Leptospira santarosai]